MQSLKGKVIAITGAASGIALQTAKVLASHGAVLALADTNKAGLEQAQADLPPGPDGRAAVASVFVVDVRDSAQVDAWIEAVVSLYGRLDGAVNLAGIGLFEAPLRDATDDQWDLVMDVNLKGVFRCMRAQIRAMLANPDAQTADGLPKSKGAIVNAASIVGQVGQAGATLYSTSKHAVVGLTRSAARENPALRINAVSPGVTDTPMNTELERQAGGGFTLPTSRQILDRKAKTHEIAPMIVFLLSDEAAFMTGSVYNVDGGFMA